MLHPFSMPGSFAERMLVCHTLSLLHQLLDPRAHPPGSCRALSCPPPPRRVPPQFECSGSLLEGMCAIAGDADRLAAACDGEPQVMPALLAGAAHMCTCMGDGVA